MNVLVWQWGRRGAGPRFAACLAEALRQHPGLRVALSLCRQAEIMRGPDPPSCELPVATYAGPISFLLRLLSAPVLLPALLHRLHTLRPDLAICAMAGPLDLLMVAALRLVGARIAVIVHDADRHPGDGWPMQLFLQRLLCRAADRIAVLTLHVGSRLMEQGLCGRDGKKLVRFTHPPFAFAIPPVDARQPGPPRLLCFGRLLPYKGLDLLAEALTRCAPGIEVRVVGLGAESPALAALRACPGVHVENQWVPETAIGTLLAWSDAVILPYREASQSGVAAAAIAAGRPVIATRVGGLAEQLAGRPHAILCAPDPASLAAAIDAWRAAPGPMPPAVDARAAWREASAELLRAIAEPSRRRERPLQGAIAANIISARTEGSPCPSALSASTLAKP